MTSQFDDTHRVLRNKFGLTDATLLESAIAELSFARVEQLNQKPLTGSFDTQHLRRIHQYIFQDVFPWAGDFREVMTARTGSFGFPPPVYILPSLETLFTQLKTERHLKGLDADTFATRAAITSANSTPSTPSEKAMAEPSVSSSAPSPKPPATVSPGPTSRPTKTTQPPASALPPATMPA